MRLIVFFLLSFLLLLVLGLLFSISDNAPVWMKKIDLLYRCVFVGGIGGVIYCLRAVYLNACVRKQWDKEWQPWYYIRPLVSLISGGVSWLFLKAGLLVLDASNTSASSSLGFLALAFIAGYNVDKFMNKLEQLSEAAWGIEKSRSANIETKDK